MRVDITVPAVLNGQGSSELLTEITAAQGKAVGLDASLVRHVGAQALQVLLAAQNAWAKAGDAFDIIEPSGDFISGVQTLGATDLLVMAEAQT